MNRTTLLAAAACLSTFALAAPASAQPVRPNILIIFDTSTSMNQINDMGQAADGSPLCSGLGDGSDPLDANDALRRTFALKKALRDTLTQVGVDEANFGLARFPQLENPGLAATCPTGHYFVDATTDVGGLLGCRVSTHTNNETTYGNWFDGGLRQFLLVDVTRKPTGAKPVAGDFDPRGANVAEIYRWLDQSEVVSNGAITDPELRAGGNTNITFTPLGRSLFYARLYFDNYVKPVDPRAGCRKNIVIVVTDGAEDCDKAPAMLNPFAQSALLYASGVDTYVLTDTSTGSANDSIAYFGSGGKRSTATRVTLTDSSAVKAALIQIIAEAVPPAEICNGIDDNCNGQIDEAPLPGVGSQCLCPGLTPDMVGKGICMPGTTVCRGAAGIKCEGCVLPQTEICNGIDDNCNGQIDEGFDLGKACDNGLGGPCKRTGVTVCKPDGSGVMCDAPAGTPSPEVCNGLDDNCNGQIDEGMLPGVGEPCGLGLGVCKAGMIKCEMGKFVCSETSMPQMEVCNGLDDNCNGLVDEGIAGIGDVCACPGPDGKTFDLKTLMTGECRPGKKVCKGREPLDCEGCVLPRNELCNGKDDNCDGMIDEGNPCPEGFICLDAKCQIVCKTGEFPCPNGYYCDKARNVCVSQKCFTVRCDNGSICDEGTGQCMDPCMGVTCTAPKVCRGGDCVDCNSPRYQCAAGMLCMNGECKAGPCTNKKCGDGEFCDENGDCVGTCPQGCATGQRCIKGECKANPCATVSCAAGQVCDPASGDCKADACAIQRCPGVGQVCVRVTGQCKDNPCQAAQCPAGKCLVCRVSDDGLPECVSDQACEANVVHKRIGAGGSGCSCAVPGAPGGGGPLAFAVGGGLLALVWRRRRRR